MQQADKPAPMQITLSEPLPVIAEVPTPVKEPSPAVIEQPQPHATPAVVEEIKPEIKQQQEVLVINLMFYCDHICSY